MCFCDPWNSPIWRNRVSLYTALTLRVLEREFHIFFSPSQIMLNWSFTMVKQIVVTIFVATNYWANSFFPLASTRPRYCLWVPPGNAKRPGIRGDWFLDQKFGTGDVLLQPQAVGADEVEVIIRLWGCISGPRRGFVMEVGLVLVVEFLIAMCAEVLFQLSVDAYYLFTRCQE